MNHKKIMLRCTRVNRDYVRLPAGKVAGLENITRLYRRIASQSVQCAEAWLQDGPCPDHEPAVDAFWWSVVAWADAFGLSMGVDMAEWSRLFVYPHDQFANYLRPGNPPSPLEPVNDSPANIILTLDARFTELVIKLTTKWGFLHHLKDKGAMDEAQQLDAQLRDPDSPAYKAYLESDLAFFRALFKLFPFSGQTGKHINARLKQAEEGG